MRALVTAFLVAVLAGPAAAESAKVPRVGVVIDLSVNVSATAAETIGGALATALARKLKVDAIGGAEVSRRLPPSGLPEECMATPACLGDLGQRLAADQLLFLGVVRIGNEYQIDITFVDVRAGTRAPRPRVQVADPAKATDAFAAQAERILPDADPRKAGGTVIVNTGDKGRRPIKREVWIIGGIGAGALLTAGIVGGLAWSGYNDCDKEATPCEQPEIDSVHTKTIIADVALGVGVAAAATAAILYVRTPREKPATAPTVTPVPGGVVLSLDGRF